jgi:hypothetical protein
LFFKRIGINSSQPYNHENPKNLKYYNVSIFNTGVMKIMICTLDILEDLKKNIFKNKKKTVEQIKGVEFVILYNFS